MKSVIKKNCIYCGKEYQRPFSEAKRSNMKFCSRSCVTANTNKKNKKQTIELFYKNTIVPKNRDECWIWQCGKTARYGQIKINGIKVGVHRFSYEYFNGKIPEGMYICHQCDQPKCVNPKHLFIGSSQDNMDDKIQKGRGKYCKGEKQAGSILSEQQVKEIKLKLKEGVYQRILSAEYGVSQTTIYKINQGIHWKHVTI